MVITNIMTLKQIDISNGVYLKLICLNCCNKQTDYITTEKVLKKFLDNNLKDNRCIKCESEDIIYKNNFGSLLKIEI